MLDSSRYERSQIESLLLSGTGRMQRGVGLFLMPDTAAFRSTHEIAIQPAMRACGLNDVQAVAVFGSESPLADVCRWTQIAEVIVADLTELNGDLLYVLGLAHGLRRCPLIIYQPPTILPFNLQALRNIAYSADRDGLFGLREELTRAIRVFLTAARADGAPD